MTAPSCVGFLLEQFALAFEAPAITGQFAVGADDAMTGNDEREGIGGAGIRHDAGGDLRIGAVDQLGHLHVALGFTDGDRTKRIPYAALNRRAADVEREIEPFVRIVGVTRDLRQVIANDGCVLNERRLRVTPRKISLQCAGIVAEKNGTNALDATGDQNLAECTVAGRIKENVGGVGGQVSRGIGRPRLS